MAGILYIVATPIGNLEDMTHRAIRILSEVNIIAAEDTRISKRLLSHYNINTPMTSFHLGNEHKKVERMIQSLESGDNVALISDAGTPCISDPGYSLVSHAHANKIQVVPIPGVSALTCALSASGLPSDTITFIGFLPDKKGKRIRALEQIAMNNHTLIIYLSPWKAYRHILDCIAVLGDRQACLCRELTKTFETFDHGTLIELSEKYTDVRPKGELVLIIASSDYSLSKN